jgi:Domain of unknown function (DUF4167)
MRRSFTPNLSVFWQSCLKFGKAADRPKVGYDRTHGGTEGFFDLLAKDDSLLINNRQQNSRRRGRGNNNQRPQGSNNGNARNQDNGNRIDNRSRGNAAQLLEKYKTLARDAQQSGDRVLTEYYLQFSDHYFRVLADTRARYEENQPRRDGGPDQSDPQTYDNGDDNDDGFDGDEFDPRPQSRVQAPQAQPRYDREQPPQEARERTDNNEDRPRRDYGDRPRNNNGNGQDRAPRDDYRRDAQPRQDQRPREDRPREERPVREERPRRDREPRPVRSDEREAASEPSTLSLDLLPPAIAVTPISETEEPVAPKRRGRPKKIVDPGVAES